METKNFWEPPIGWKNPGKTGTVREYFVRWKDTIGEWHEDIVTASDFEQARVATGHRHEMNASAVFEREE